MKYSLPRYGIQCATIVLLYTYSELVEEKNYDEEGKEIWVWSIIVGVVSQKWVKDTTHENAMNLTMKVTLYGLFMKFSVSHEHGA